MKKPSFKLLKELATKGGTHDIGDLQITFHYKRDAKRLDSFWFHGQDIVTVTYKERCVVASCQGDMSVLFEEDDDYNFSGDNAVNEALRRNYTDKNLIKISDHDGWRSNNWIELNLSLNITTKTRKQILSASEFWIDNLNEFIKASELSQTDFERAMNTSLWLEDWIMDTYDEAIDNAVENILDDKFWKTQKEELIKEAIHSFEL